MKIKKNQRENVGLEKLKFKFPEKCLYGLRDFLEGIFKYWYWRELSGGGEYYLIGQNPKKSLVCMECGGKIKKGTIEVFIGEYKSVTKEFISFGVRHSYEGECVIEKI